MRKVFLDDLPKRGTFIDWKNCIGRKVKFIYDDVDGDLEIINYYLINNHPVIDAEYNNEISSIYLGSFKKCQLGYLLKKQTNQYKYNIGDVVITKTGEIEILELIRISRNKGRTEKGYKYKCLIDENIDVVYESNLSKGVGCNVCVGRKVLKGVNDFQSNFPEYANLLKYPEQGYKISFGSNKTEIFICPNCYYEKSYMINKIINNGLCCNKCGDGFSFPNKIAFNLLEQLRVDFIPEYSPDWIKPKRYDFYFELDNKKYIVEMDGGLGHGYKNNLNGRSKEDRKLTKEKDRQKEILAERHDIQIIRIDCLKSDLEYIKNNILNSKLNDLFNLSTIDWLNCYKFAYGSRVKEAVNYWNNGIRNTVEIGKIMKISRNTIAKYLKQGNELGLCDYDPKYIQRQNGKFASEKRKKQFIVC